MRGKKKVEVNRQLLLCLAEFPPPLLLSYLRAYLHYATFSLEKDGLGPFATKISSNPALMCFMTYRKRVLKSLVCLKKSLSVSVSLTPLLLASLLKTSVDISSWLYLMRPTRQGTVIISLRARFDYLTKPSDASCICQFLCTTFWWNNNKIMFSQNMIAFTEQSSTSQS